LAGDVALRREVLRPQQRNIRRPPAPVPLDAPASAWRSLAPGAGGGGCRSSPLRRPWLGRRRHARTTKDVDLTIRTTDERELAERLAAIREQLQEAAELDLGDHLEFRIASAKKQLPGAPQGGASFPVDALLVGKIFGRFHIDVGFSDPVQGEPDVLTGDDILAFAGIGPARALAVPKAQQFAEKLHAYTYVWDDRENTRVKDLVDMVMLIQRGELDVAQVRSAVDETFARRNTHILPDQLKQPPMAWAAEFPAMAKQAGLSMADIEGAFDVLVQFAEELGIGRASR